MDERHRESADWVRGRIGEGRCAPPLFRAALTRVPPAARDAWVDRVLGLGPPPEDGPELPVGCVPYLPCSVDALLRLVEHAPVRASDLFVDVGSGVGRAAAVVHLLTGAQVVGVEVQPTLVAASRALTARLGLPRISFVQGDAGDPTDAWAAASVFLLYCPFSGARLAKLLANLEPVARTRPIRVCCVDLPLPPCPWLERTPPASPDLTFYRSKTGLERAPRLKRGFLRREDCWRGSLVKKGALLMGQPAVGFRRRHLTLIPDPEAEPLAPWRQIASEVQATIALLQPELARTIRPFLSGSLRGEELARRLEAPIAMVVGRIDRGRLRLGEALRDWLAPPDRRRVRRPRW